MDREILFRGKRINNGEWVEGDLVHSIYKLNDTCVGKYGCTLGMHQVIPETVGQYTGLLDKNGKKIFEGDIIKIRNKTRYVFFGVCRYRHTNYGEYAVDLSVKDGSNCEVIGNIHDNTDLLEQED